MSQTFLYVRVSTNDQNSAHQEAQARAAGFKIDRVFTDHGVSGVKVPLKEREQGKLLLTALRSGDVLVVRWVDRLGRNYADVTDTIRELMRMGVVVKTVINGMTFDGATADPMQMAVRDALISFMAATAQAQAEATKEAQKAGIAHAKASEQESKYRGRKPKFTRAQFDQVRDMLAAGATNANQIAKAAEVDRSVVYHVRDDAAKVEAALAAWGM